MMLRTLFGQGSLYVVGGRLPPAFKQLFPYIGPLRLLSTQLKDHRKSTGLHWNPTKTASMAMTENSNPEYARLTSAIKDAIERKSFKDALNSFRQAITPDTILYNCIIYAAVELREYDKGWALFCEMKDAGVMTNVGTYRNVITLLGRKGDRKMAREMFQQALRVDREASKDNVLLSALLEAVAVTGDWKSVRNEMVAACDRGLTLNSVNYSHLLQSFSKASLPGKVFETLSYMHQRALQPNVVHYTILLKACSKEVCKSKDLIKRDDYFNRIQHMMQEHAIQENCFSVEAKVRLLLMDATSKKISPCLLADEDATRTRKQILAIIQEAKSKQIEMTNFLKAVANLVSEDKS